MTRRAAILTEIPFLGRSDDGAKRARMNEPLDASTNRENDQLVLNRVVAALRELYASTQSEWIRQHWHSALAHADVAAEHAAKTDQSERLIAAFRNAVGAECSSINSVMTKQLATGVSAEKGEPLLLLLRNFVFRTQKRAEAASALDATLFRPAGSRSMAELANERLSSHVLTEERQAQISECILLQFRADHDQGLRLALAYLQFFNYPGLSAPVVGPWKPIADAVWERACSENEQIVLESASNPDLLSDPTQLLATINGWILNVLRSGARAYQLVVLMRNRGGKQPLVLCEKQWLEKLAQTPAKPYAVWAEFALRAVRHPLEAGATLKLLRQFYKHGNHSLWRAEEWPALFRVVLDRAVRESADVVAQHDIAWRVLAALSPGIAREHERRFREVFLREAYHVLGTKFFASVFKLLLLHRAGESTEPGGSRVQLAALLKERLRPKESRLNMGDFGELSELGSLDLGGLDSRHAGSGTSANVESPNPGPELGSELEPTESRRADKSEYLAQAIYGDALPAVRACERLLFPMPAHMARTLFSAVLFANDMMIHDGGGYETELYTEVARCFMPKPLGENRRVVTQQLQAFNDLTGDEFHHVNNLINEITEQASSPALVLNSGNWVCDKDPYLATALPPALEPVRAHLAYRAAEPETGPQAKTYRWHLTWSTVLCELGGGEFSCSWRQLEWLRMLWESPEPLSQKTLVGKVMIPEYGEQLLEDLVQRSNGFVRYSTRDSETYYAIDSGVNPTGDWAVLQFANEWA